MLNFLSSFCTYSFSIEQSPRAYDQLEMAIFLNFEVFFFTACVDRYVRMKEKLEKFWIRQLSMVNYPNHLLRYSSFSI